MIGARFGRLIVLSETRHESRKGRFYVCRCDCGKEFRAYSGHLRAGSTQGCGCVRRGAKRTHGMSRTLEYRSWESAKARCYLPTNPRFEHYGARGIGMCEQWRSSFEAFYADMGPRPSQQHTLDRIDNDRGYEPGNCRWATSEQQNNNRSINRFVLVNGERLTVAQASRATGIPHATISGRLAAGATDQEATLA